MKLPDLRSRLLRPEPVVVTTPRVDGLRRVVLHTSPNEGLQVCVVGMPRSGKTRLAEATVVAWQAHGSHVLMLSHHRPRAMSRVRESKTGWRTRKEIYTDLSEAHAKTVKWFQEMRHVGSVAVVIDDLRTTESELANTMGLLKSAGINAMFIMDGMNISHEVLRRADAAFRTLEVTSTTHGLEDELHVDVIKDRYGDLGPASMHIFKGAR